MFRTMTKAITDWAGSPAAVIGSIVLIIVWAALGPIFSFSDTWQLYINTGTTILTFNMVFVIQATQNRSDTAVQTKLDELIRATKGARNRVIDLEDDDDIVVKRLREELQRRKNG
jgi:low affinity Fe/Cu permease